MKAIIPLLALLIACYFISCKKTPLEQPNVYHPDTFHLTLLDYNTKLPIPGAAIEIYRVRDDTACACSDTIHDWGYTDSAGYFPFLRQLGFYYQWLIPQKDGYWCPMIYDPSPPQSFITGFHAVDTIYLFKKAWLRTNFIHSSDTLLPYNNEGVFLNNYNGPGERFLPAGGFGSLEITGYEYLFIPNFMNDTTFIDPVISDQTSTCFFYYSGAWYPPNPNIRDTSISFYVATGDTGEITLPY